MLQDGEYIEIQGNLAQIVERRVVRQTRLQDVLGRLETSAPVTLPTIARSQVFGHLDGSNRDLKRWFVLTEIPAGIRSISKNLSDGTARRYRLSMPHTYIWFVCETNSETMTGAWSIVEYRIFHSRTRYNGINTEMIVARLPNVYGSGEICWGATGASPNITIADRLDQLTNQWYLSRFNSDLDGNVPLPYNEPNYRRWVQETRDDINSWQNWPEWTSRDVTKYTVRELLETHGQTPRIEEIILPNAIPEIPIRATFARWDQFFLNLPPEQRTRARISLDNLALDDPANLAPIEEEPVNDPFDDGGVEIEYAR